MWDNIQLVTAVLSLSAFTAATGIGAWRRHLRMREHFIRKDAEQGNKSIVINELNRYGVDASKLTPNEQLAALEAAIQTRYKRLTYSIYAALTVGVASATGSFAQYRNVAPAGQWQLPSDYIVWFGTNRRPLIEGNPEAGFSGLLDGKTHYGTCTVHIPKAHRFGSVGSGWKHRLLTLTDDRLKLTEISPLDESSFWRSVKTELARWEKADEKQALVYIHGFNVSFQEAAIRAAQVGFDLKALGATAFFSWPSRGQTEEYKADEASIEASEAAITEFLVRFAETFGTARVHIIAHSMGNRGLLRAMQRIQTDAQRQTSVRFGQIILAAPDVGTALFTNLAGAYLNLSTRTTIYASPSDKAVGLSQWIHKAPRAGFTPPVVVVQGLDTVEVPNFDLDALGHSYYAEAEAVLSDIYTLLRSNRSPDDRQRLQTTRLANGERYWLILP